MNAKPLLQVEDLSAFYGDLQVLRGLKLDVHAGEIVAIVGANAAGKSTLLRALSGIIKRTGSIAFDDRDLGRNDGHCGGGAAFGKRL